MREGKRWREREIVVGKDSNTVEGYIEATDASRFWGLRLSLFCLELFSQVRVFILFYFLNRVFLNLIS
jgi:hypothetical protein